MTPPNDQNAPTGLLLRPSPASRFWDWFDRAPEWLVLAVLFVASGVVTLLAVVGALYLLGGVL